MTQPDDKPTPEEIKRAKEILRQENEKPDVQQSGGGIAGIYAMLAKVVLSLPRSLLIGAAAVYLGYHAWDYYNAARRDPAETQEIMAKAAAAQAEADAQNKKVGNDTVRGAAVEAEMEKLRAEAAAAKATADALTQQINGLTQAEGQKRAELEKLANEAKTAGAEARAATAVLLQQKQAELAKTQADARISKWSADYLDGVPPSGGSEGDLFGNIYNKVTGAGARQAPPRTQEASGGYVSSAPATVVPPELKLRSCAGFFERMHRSPAVDARTTCYRY